MGIDGAVIAARKTRIEASLKTCPACNGQVSKNAPSCPHCGEPLKKQINNHAATAPFSPKVATGVAGAGLVIIGTFCPIITFPIMGSLNYFANGKGDGTILLVFAAMSLLFIFMRRLWFLVYTGSACLIVLGVTLYQIQQRLDQMTTDAQKELAGNPFMGLADAAINSVQMQWGWAVLLIGAMLMITAAILDKRDNG